jgi:hypothetical protein
MMLDDVMTTRVIDFSWYWRLAGILLLTRRAQV